MADTKFSGLPAVAAAALTDILAVDQGGTSKQETIAQIVALLETLGKPRVRTLLTDHAIASATATKLTDLDATLEAGTYAFKYSGIMQSSATGIGLSFGLNFTGTAAVRAFHLYYPSTGTTASTGVADDVGAAAGQLMEANAQTAFSTTTGNLAFTGGVATAAANIPFFIEGVLVVTASGDLQLFHGSESATSTTVKAGTNLVVTRTA